MKNKTKQDEFMKVYNPIHDSFVRYCKAKSYGIIDAEDLVNESITRAFESFDTLKNKEIFPAYIYGIVKNIINNELRKRNINKKYDLYKINQETLVKNHAEQKFEIEILYKALSQLSESKKEAIILFEISGYSIKEIAVIQDSKESAVKQRLKRGREELAKIICNSEQEKKSIKGDLTNISNTSSLLLLIGLCCQNI